MLLGFLLQAGASSATFCKKWSTPKTEGVLERKFVPEASGVAASVEFPGRIYWVNDSGNTSQIFHGKINGNEFKKIGISDATFRDTEAMTTAECGADLCLIVGDIGNNKLKKRASELYIFKEKDLTGDKAKPFRKVKFTYPDGEHDAEAMATLPNGDLIFITKETSLMSGQEPTLFMLPKSDWLEGTGEFVARDLGQLPMGKLLPDKGFLGTAVTDAAVNLEREVLGVLTYAALVEIPLEKIKGFKIPQLWERDRDFALVPIKSLNQQETMTYLPKSPRVVWSTEFFPPSIPIYQMECERTGY